MLSRVPVNRAATLTHYWYVGETLTDPTGTPTATAVDANGTTVSLGAVAITGSNTGATTSALAAQTTLKRITVTWVATVGGSSVTEVDYVEVVGGFLFTLYQARHGSNNALSNATTYPAATVEALRLEVEQECEWICDRAFVPRYEREVLDGSGTPDLVLQRDDLRSIRRVSMSDRPNGTFTDLTTTQLAAVARRPARVIRRTDGLVFTEGSQNIIVEYEYGLDLAPADLSDAAVIRLRTLATRPNSGIPDRTQSFSTIDGNTYRLTLPEAFTTGIPDVDAAYGRYSLREGVGSSGTDKGAPVPASRTLTYAPQKWSLFHR